MLKEKEKTAEKMREREGQGEGRGERERERERERVDKSQLNRPQTPEEANNHTMQIGKRKLSFLVFFLNNCVCTKG